MVDVDAMRTMLREACAKAGTQSAWAKEHSLSAAYVSDVLAGRREPGLSIAKAFGYQPVTMYEKRKGGK